MPNSECFEFQADDRWKSPTWLPYALRSMFIGHLAVKLLKRWSVTFESALYIFYYNLIIVQVLKNGWIQDQIHPIYKKIG